MHDQDVFELKTGPKILPGNHFIKAIIIHMILRTNDKLYSRR